MTLKVMDLFSGAGGMSSGFKRNSAFKLVAAVDYEVSKPSRKPGHTSCNQTYEANIGIKPMFADLHKLSPEDLAKHFGLTKDDVDVLISCPPCTGFSQKNAKNHGNDDRRNSLVVRTAKFVSFFMPKYLVMENVKELLVGNNRHHFFTLKRKLEALGYHLSYQVHDLADFGLPQSRKRALVIAKYKDKPPRLQSRNQPIRTVRDVIGHLPELENGETCTSDDQHTCPKATTNTIERMQAIPKDGGSWIDMAETHPDLLIPSMKPERPDSFPDIYGRLAWDVLAPTITRECGSPGNGRYTHPEQNRLLSVREMSMLQGFPEDYKFLGHLGSKYRQVGDAVPPLVSAQIADVISINH